MIGGPTARPDHPAPVSGITALLFALLSLSGCPRADLDTFDADALAGLEAHDRNQLDGVRARLHEHDPGQLAPIFLKVAFPVDRRGYRDEWMWIQVVRWEDDLVEGILVNQPRRRTDLVPGAYVQVAPSRIADYQDGRGADARGNALRSMRGGSLVPADLLDRAR